MTDETTPKPGIDATGDGDTVLRAQLAATRENLRRLESQVEVLSYVRHAGSGQLVAGGAAVAALLMAVGLLMKVFIPVSGEDKSLTLFQVLDPEYEPDLLDSDGSWKTGPGWWIPIVMVVVCIVLVISVAAASGVRPRALVTVAEVFCWCLAIGCLLGFATLANSRNVVAVPGALVTILIGAVVAVLTCRLARALA